MAKIPMTKTRKYYFIMSNKESLIFWSFDNLNLEFVSKFGQFYKIRRASDLILFFSAPYIIQGLLKLYV
jgi:hypothetical protein